MKEVYKIMKHAENLQTNIDWLKLRDCWLCYKFHFLILH